MNAVLLILVLPCGLFHDAGRLPSQDRWQYYYGCTPGNQHCERCRPDGCGGACYDYRRRLNYPWLPPCQRPISEETLPDVGPRIIPLEYPLPEELPAPKPDERSPSDKKPSKK